MLFSREEFDHDMCEKATAMLATCRRRMTGMEIDMCEKLATMLDDDFEPFALHRDYIAWFDSMTVQFAKEIAAWINKHGRVPA